MCNPGEQATSLKEQANAEFANEQYLKAAALYTKAIKLDPENAVIYSNRSAALLKLKKVTKALEDADECIKLRPDWEKGFFRKAAVLEAQESFEEAQQVYEQALQLNPESKELTAKMKALQKLMHLKKTGKSDFKFSNTTPSTTTSARSAPASHPPAAVASKASKPSATAAAPETSASQTGQASQQQVQEDLGSPEVAMFLQAYLEHLAAEVHEAGSEPPLPMVHFLPGSPDEPFEEHETHIRATAAFDSPETLGGFVDFVRATGQRLDARAVLSITMKSLVAFPQTWSKPGWPCGAGDGALVQLEARNPKLKKLWFVPVDAATRSCGTPWSGLDPDAFALLPTLLR